MPSDPLFLQTMLLGLGATAVMDVGLALQSRLGIPNTGFAMVGRWVGHFRRGVFRHAAIAKATPVPGERVLGWLTHYLIGMAFAALQVGLQGRNWLAQPTLLPALAFGVLTVAAPWFVMQPALGAGMLARKTQTPLRNGLRSLVNHATYGAGLYLTAVTLSTLAA